MRVSGGWRSFPTPVEMKTTSRFPGRRSEREKYFSVAKINSESPLYGTVEAGFIKQRGSFVVHVCVESIFSGEPWEISRRSRIVRVNGSEDFVLDEGVGIEMNI